MLIRAFLADDFSVLFVWQNSSITEDSKRLIPVVYDGVKPDMYREGQGVVVEGRMDGGGVLRADTLLVKHSEEYSIDEAKVKDKERMYRTLMKEKP